MGKNRERRQVSLGSFSQVSSGFVTGCWARQLVSLQVVCLGGREELTAIHRQRCQVLWELLVKLQLGAWIGTWGGPGYDPEALAVSAGLHSHHINSRLSCFIFNDKSLLVVRGNRPYTRVFFVSDKGNDASEERLDAMLRLMKSFLFKELPYIVPSSCVLGVHLLFLSLLITTDSSQSNDFEFCFFGWVLFHFRIKAKNTSNPNQPVKLLG